ncbi:hypothetical protein AVEN_140030-1 [Araneus ventricosus]|uniref:Uncharacterized protein n=1 Tax=Araneus ventricosus TaxID=182803 RepID=A0A4Y2PC17_ARAVE|nr:hypothetical protein AVEN_140030-1 [Araneus ventricosus]
MIIKVPLSKKLIDTIQNGEEITLQIVLQPRVKTLKKYGGDLLIDILSRIKPTIYEKLEPFLNIPKILEILENNKFGAGIPSYSNIKKSSNKQFGGLFKVLDIFKKEQPKLFGGFLPFLIPILTSLGLGTASGAAGWLTKKALDKMTGSGKPKPKGFHLKKKTKNGKGVYHPREYPT